MYLFLDIDGVLNRFSSLSKLSPKDPLKKADIPLEEDCIQALNGILKATKAKVILSSGWKDTRSISEVQKMLKRAGFKGKIIDKTPSLKGQGRGEEIAAWLKAKKNLDQPFVILDDRGDLEPLKDKLVQSSFYTGLTEELAQEAINMLKTG
jgi:hypothetical protein